MNKEIVEFKSDPYFFDKEKTDIKNNTIRKTIDYRGDHRFDKLLAFKEKINDNDLYIKIVNSRDKTLFFERKIRDVSCYRDLFIITWYPEK
jgi:hypothetical protein